MSNQCSSFCNYRSFSFCTPFLTPLKPYTTALRPFFPFQHNLILIGRRSRRRSSSSSPLLNLAAQSSSDIVLIATEEHHDGSLIFRFGDASEVVENNDVVREIDSQTEEESSVVKVLDGDQDTQVIIKTGGGGYDSVEGGLIEVVDGIRNVDIDGDGAESETNATRDLRDYNAESSERLSDISEKEVLLSQSDAKINNSLEVVESTIDEAKFSAQLDGEESSDSTINLLDNIPNIEKSADTKGMPLKGSDDKTVDPSVSVKLESTQVSQVEGYLDKVETEDTRKSDTEDITPSAFPATMQISDVELKDDANKDVEEELKDMVIDEGMLIDELPASNALDVRLTDAVNEDVEQELKDTNIDEAAIIDEMPSTDQFIVEPTLDEVSQLQSIEDELQQTSTKNREENDVAYVMPVISIEEAEIIVEEELIVSDTAELKPTFQALNTDLQDTMGQNLDNGILPVDNEIMDPSVSVKLETIQVSDNEVTKARQSYTEDESHMAESEDINEGDTKDLLPPATMHVSDVDMDERLQDMNISEATFIDDMPTSDPLGAEPTLEVSTTKGMDVKDADMDERLQDMNITEATFIDEMPTSDPLGAEPTLEVSTTKDMDDKDADMDERLQDMNVSEANFIDEMPTSDPVGAEPALEVSTSQGMDIKDADMNERLQDMNISEATSIDEMPTYDLLGAEPTLEVSTTKGIDVKDEDMDERLQDMNITEATFIDEVPTSDPLGGEPTLEVSNTKGIDSKDADMDERLQDMNISEATLIDEMPTTDHLGAEPYLEVSTTKGIDGKDADRDERLQDMNISETAFIDEMPTSDPLGAEPTLEVSTTKGMEVKDVDVQERLQIMNFSDGTIIDEMPTYDPLEDEPYLEVSTTEGMDIKDLAVEDESQLVSNVNMDENEIADVMPAKPTVEEEVSQPHLTPVEFKATMQVSDIKVQDVTGQNLDNEILQVIDEDLEQLSRQLESQPVQDEGVKYNMLEPFTESNAVEGSILLKQDAHDTLLEAERTEGIVSSSALAEASEITAVMLAAEAEVEVESREEIYLTDYFLLSSAALLEHPSKALTGGDDAYFVSGSKWLGVANGVNKWSFEGTDRGVYAQELMRTCEEIVLDTSSVPMINPVELLCRGVKETNMSGSANVLVANFNGQDLHVAYIGDTGFLIIRHGTIYKKSSPLLHGFHFASQVEESDDPLQLVEEYLIELEVGDIVVSATDGLFDNVYEREVTMIVSKSLQAGMKPQEIANILATRAQEVGKSAYVRSPFSDAAQAAGYTGYAGGKPDNVAVIVSLVEKGSKLLVM
ncbi:hypothetical protein SSX86_009594 [Deinandra increscens subsp. villosa]|uniref:PPM-type phosphatase domain-containing protein n=1 Tax=Deinandra increscens subsp. villosa TaxID=3103831 RepID=A0AAP0H3J1_9ASTR